MGRPFWPGVPGSALMGGRTVQESLGCPSHFTQRPSSRASRVYAGAVGNPPGPGAPKAGPAHPAQECPPWGSGAATAGPAPSAASFCDLYRSTTSRKRRRAAPHLPAFISPGRN